ncbi:hypothetical protein FHS29_005474 [Saccharothrix tamanrassetensis]|uniref:Uncharacterized protein n=1 Tax=Saccharothrix tamanrassetensis TaxID=1051531 RepID=A0A841CSB7_9PSEU|nr:DUF6541 family protein [Saccharothrix tamanrassetensis]MBB5958865.1 hypothetical protein [Saccharothrix tamanrassetensis]
MISRDAIAIAVALLVVVLPGAALLFAFRVRVGPWFVGLSAAASVGVATLTAMACAVVGLRYGPVTLGVVTGVLLAVGAFRWFRGRGERHRRTPVAWRAGQLLGALLTIGAMVLAGIAWWGGLDTLSTVGQEHDLIVHHMLTAYIQRSGNGAPWQVLPADVLTGSGVAFYPAGVHLLAGVTGAVIGDTVVALNAVTIVVLGFGWAASLAALAYVAARRGGLGTSSATLAGGVAALVGAGLYRPVFSLMHEGGILANASAMVLVPGVLAALLSVPRKGWSAVVPLAIGCLGILAVHPTSLASVGVSLVAWLIGDALVRGGWRRVLGELPKLAAAGGLAVVIGLPLLLQILGVGGGAVDRFGADIAPQPFSQVVGNALGLVYSGWVPDSAGYPQFAAVLMTLLGVVAVLMTRRGMGALTAWFAWLSIEIAFATSPTSGPETPLAGLFYNAHLRIWSHLSLFVPVLAGLGVAITASGVALWLARVAPATRSRVRWVSLALAFLAGAGYLFGPGVKYAEVGAEYLTTRYSKSHFSRVGPDDEAAIAWLADRVRPGERVLNSANDGSTFLYVEKGIPIVNAMSLGSERAPYTYELLKRFNRYPEDAEVRKMLRDLNVRWLYVDVIAPGIGSGISPNDWVGQPNYALAPGFADLDGLPGLSLGFRSGTVSVYELDPDAAKAP